MIPSEDNNLCERISFLGDVIGLERLTNYPREALKYIRSDGKSLLHMIPDCPK